MTSSVLTPFELSTATKTGPNTFRKQLLPFAEIDYRGTKLSLNKEKLEAMVQSFTDGAYDTVPLVFADGKNNHTMDPRFVTGEVIGMEVTDHGLDMLVSTSDEAAKLLSNYPKFGVSARFFENLERSDGKKFPAAVQHALITLDPVIAGMSPWEPISLSNAEGEELDLSTQTYAALAEAPEPEEKIMAGLTEEEIAQMRELLQLVNAVDDGDTEDEETPEQKAAREAAEAKAAEEAGADGDENLFSDEDLEALAAAAAAEVDAEEKALVEASKGDTGDAVELANARIGEQAVELAALREKLEAKDFAAEKASLARQFGIPPAVTELAKPLLMGTQVVELSNGTSVDAGEVMRNVLKELGKTTKLMDLSHDIGNAVDVDNEVAEADERAAFLAKAKAQGFGIG